MVLTDYNTSALNKNVTSKSHYVNSPMASQVISDKMFDIVICWIKGSLPKPYHLNHQLHVLENLLSRLSFPV